MKNFDQLVSEALADIREITPWELGRRLAGGETPLLLDVREPAEFSTMHIPGSINAPRGVLEQSCEWNFDETLPELVMAREREVVVICRSGRRSALATAVMQQMGYSRVVSLKLGIRGWNDAELPLENAAGEPLDADAGDAILTSRIQQDQRKPTR